MTTEGDIPTAEFAGMLIIEMGARVSYNKISLLQESDLLAQMPFLLICSCQAIRLFLCP